MAQTMIRKQMYITREQEGQLKRLAKEKSVPEAELLREALAQLFEAQWKRERSDAAWAAIEAFIKRQEERVQEEKAGTRHRWTREEFYEDRMDRYG